MLRLDKDQEAYHFVMWYQLVGGDYDWDDMNPFLNMQNANAFEWPVLFGTRTIELNHTVALMLLKIKLLVDLRTLQDSNLLGVKVPREMLDRIQTHVPRSPIIANSREIMQRRNHTEVINNSEELIELLFHWIEAENKYFWPAMVKPNQHLTARPEYFASGTKFEMQLVLQYSCNAWIETLGAMDVIKDYYIEDYVDEGQYNDFLASFRSEAFLAQTMEQCPERLQAEAL